MSQQCQNEYFSDFSYSNQFANNEYPIAHPLLQESSSFDLHQHSASLVKYPLLAPSQNQKKGAKTTQNNSEMPQKPKKQQNTQKKVTDQEICFDSSVLLRNREVLRGDKNDTVQLNIHFKTILCNFFKELVYTNELSPSEITKYKQFCRRVPSFKSLKEFLCQESQGKGIDRLRQVCLDFVESGQCVRRILWCRCKFGVKLQMLKFVSKLGANLKQKEIVRWKQQPNYFKIQS